MQVRKDHAWLRMGAVGSMRSRQASVQIVFRTQRDLPIGQMWSGKENVHIDSCSLWPQESEAWCCPEQRRRFEEGWFGKKYQTLWSCVWDVFLWNVCYTSKLLRKGISWDQNWRRNLKHYAPSLSTWSKKANRSEKLIWLSHNFKQQEKFSKDMEDLNNKVMRLDQIYRTLSCRIRGFPLLFCYFPIHLFSKYLFIEHLTWTR